MTRDEQIHELQREMVASEAENARLRVDLKKACEERDEARRLYDELAEMCEEKGERLRLWS